MAKMPTQKKRIAMLNDIVFSENLDAKVEIIKIASKSTGITTQRGIFIRS